LRCVKFQKKKKEKEKMRKEGKEPHMGGANMLITKRILFRNIFRDVLGINFDKSRMEHIELLNQMMYLLQRFCDFRIDNGYNDFKRADDIMVSNILNYDIKMSDIDNNSVELYGNYIEAIQKLRVLMFRALNIRRR
jgi:hypothetical protein